MDPCPTLAEPRPGHSSLAYAESSIPNHALELNRLNYRQWRRAIEALEARAPPDGVATLVNSLQNRVKSITLCVTLNAKNGK